MPELLGPLSVGDDGAQGGRAQVVVPDAFMARVPFSILLRCNEETLLVSR